MSYSVAMWLIITAVVCAFTLVNCQNRGLHLPDGVTQEDYCSGCLATANVFQTDLDDTSKNTNGFGFRFSNLKKNCKRKNFNETQELHKTTCLHIIDKHVEDIEENYHRVKTYFDKWLCHELTFACMGLKRNQQKQKEEEFTEEDLAKLLEEHKDKVRMPNPTRHMGDEL